MVRVVVTCDQCGVEGSSGLSTGSHVTALLRRELALRGWVVRCRRGEDKCPACQEAEKRSAGKRLAGVTAVAVRGR